MTNKLPTHPHRWDMTITEAQRDAIKPIPAKRPITVQQLLDYTLIQAPSKERTTIIGACRQFLGENMYEPVLKQSIEQYKLDWRGNVRPEYEDHE